ncbi:unnamed protein product [Linum tenue]|nr:unnamed protein product [Linum tenue]
MTNMQTYRHIESPGWTLGWKWAKKEVIWSVLGAQASDQGDCSSFKENLPHSCKKNPSIIDLLPNAPFNQQFSQCCKGGVLASQGQDPAAAVSSFQISIGRSGTSKKTISLPQDFYLLGSGPGYTCTAAAVVSPSAFYLGDGRRRSQALMTWSLTCSYSQTIVSKNPSCCVSMSSFYSTQITPCPSCSCGCQQEPFSLFPNRKEDHKISSLVEKSKAERKMVQCTEHMCPIKVHWHVKNNYKTHWRVKLTVTNFRYRTNYTKWTLAVHHPSLRSLANVSSFLYKPLMVYGASNDTGMFYGIDGVNAVLLEAGSNGNVQSEILLQKDNNSSFSLEHGWPFPWRIYFNGDECAMPSPDTYPSLPSSARFSAPTGFGSIKGYLQILVFIVLIGIV